MFLKLLISLFSILILIKNFSYAMYEYDTNKNAIGAVCVALLSLSSVAVLNIVLFFIKF